jgi:crotonobetainyl-CoA:carnitine CoA-transferase CaiB-like acyl-CoA transferase
MLVVLTDVSEVNSASSFRVEVIRLSHLDPGDWASQYLRNIGSTADIHKVQRPKGKFNINTEPPWTPKISSLRLNANHNPHT